VENCFPRKYLQTIKKRKDSINWPNLFDRSLKSLAHLDHGDRLVVALLCPGGPRKSPNHAPARTKCGPGQRVMLRMLFVDSKDIPI